jgi:uncharacterized glyoxalase superfamily protein PhnB
MPDKDKSIAPEGFSSITPYLMVESVEKQVDFLTKVFDVKFREPLRTPDGSIIHVVGMLYEVAIIIGKTRPGLPQERSINYIFTADVDKVYNRAINYGAKSLMKPVDQFYGFRECGVVDEQKNQWWIANEFEYISPEEIRRRIQEMGQQE